MLMSKPEALFKLLRLAPMAKAEIRICTGWTTDELESAISECRKKRLIRHKSSFGSNCGGRMFFAVGAKVAQ